MTLNAMMLLSHLTNDKFTLFHFVNCSHVEACHLLTIMNSAKSYAHVMISTLLSYFQWKFSKQTGEWVASIIAIWFKLAACAWTADTYWDPYKECVIKFQ